MYCIITHTHRRRGPHMACPPAGSCQPLPTVGHSNLRNDSTHLNSDY